MEKKYVGATSVELLIISFIVLKLCNVIAWSWWWVLSPIWITLSVIITVVVIAIIIDNR